MAPISESESASPCVSFDPPDIENLMAVNPKVKPFVNTVPSAVTKKKKLNYKRNANKAENLNSCG